MGFENPGKLVEGDKLFKFAALMSVLILGAFLIDVGLFIAAASAVAGIAGVIDAAVAGTAGVIDAIVGGFFENVFRAVFSIISCIALGFPTLIFKIACGDVPWGELAWLLAALVGLLLSGSIP